jgi:mono/diheme cytochrome c family protein
MKVFIFTIFLSLSVFAQSGVVNSYLKTLNLEVLKEEPAFSGFDAKRGEVIFTSKHIGKKAKEISCVSCHGNDLSKKGENFFTGKVIEPLSPTTNIERLSNLKDMKKWLRRNFMDVYNREGTAKEKGDVVTYIMSK